MQIIETDKAPRAIGPYSQAIKYENLIFISGQIAIDPESNQFIGGGIEQQTARVLENIKAILQEAGLNLDHVVKTTIYLKNLEDFVVVNQIYSHYFKDHRPARATVEVSRLPKDALIEIDAIAGL
ncbi:MAG: RidA family protein [Hydrogenothermaceae bacterium]|nr:RidA family protein [Hydrogenothermaceae bacterium]